MSILSPIVGVVLILIVLGDAFETIVLPRRVTRQIRLARLFFRYTWRPWSAIVSSVYRGRRQETYLSFYGPFSLLLLLMVWATGLIFGFAFLYSSTGTAVHLAGKEPGFGTDLYFSGTTFFTLGLGDVSPRSTPARVITAIEAGLGFGFLAMVIGYLPAITQSFSRRESSISLLDSRAGSPPTASEMLRRNSTDTLQELQQLLRDWEVWSAELLESHLSYPVLAYFRSQHDNQSWLGALAVVLDACALVRAGMKGSCAKQAELTFAIARHAVVDLSLIFRTPPRKITPDRLSSAQLEILRSGLASLGLKLSPEDGLERRLSELRRLYEPYLYSLAGYLRFSIPPWIPDPNQKDNWQTSAWGNDFAIGDEEAPRIGREHF